MRKLLLMLLALCWLLPASTTYAQDDEVPPDPLAIFLHQYEAINAGDLEGSLDYVKDDTVVVVIPPPPGTNVYEVGLEPYRAVNGYLIGNNAQYEFLEIAVTGNTITFRFNLVEDFFRLVGVYPIEFSGSAVVHDGMIVSETLIMNERDAAMLGAAVTEFENKALLQRFYQEIWTEGDLAVIDEIIAEDFVDQFSGQNGREAFRGTVELFRSAFSDLSVNYENVIADGDIVVAEVTFSGTYTGGLEEIFGIPDSAIGNEVTWGGVDYARIVDGQYVEGWGTHDDLGWFTQLGMELQAAE
ncbi:MAG TPA: ester cyclase [Caldilineaceae bacterium]|nr:ester cyclase [Caldilineaceae bacterium]